MTTRKLRFPCGPRVAHEVFHILLQSRCYGVAMEMRLEKPTNIMLIPREWGEIVFDFPPRGEVFREALSLVEAHDNPGIRRHALDLVRDMRDRCAELRAARETTS